MESSFAVADVLGPPPQKEDFAVSDLLGPAPAEGKEGDPLAVAPPDPEKPGSRPPPNWESLYSGIEGMSERLSPEARISMDGLDKVSENPAESKARAVNQAYVQSDLPGMPPEYLSRNWDAVKSGYAKEKLGVDDPAITDQAFYSKVGEAMKNRLEISAKLNSGALDPWTWNSFKKGFEVLTHDERGLPSFAKRFVSNAEAFWQSAQKPVSELPAAPANLPNKWFPLPDTRDPAKTGFVQVAPPPINPALMGAIWNGVKPALEGVESPLGIATFPLAGSLHVLGETYPLAKGVLTTMSGVFTGLMAKSTYDQGGKFWETIHDPKATFQDEVEAGVHMFADGSLAMLSALGTAFGVLPEAEAKETAKSAEKKTPGDVGKILRNKADGTESNVQKEALHNAAFEMEELNRHSQIAGDDALSPKPEPEKLKENTTLGELVGKPVRYGGYGGTLIRGREGEFLILRGAVQKGDAQYVEVEQGGKSPEVLANEVGVVPEGGWDAAVKPKKGQIIDRPFSSETEGKQALELPHKEPVKPGEEPAEEPSKPAVQEKAAKAEAKVAAAKVARVETPEKSAESAIEDAMSIRHEDIDRAREEEGMEHATGQEKTSFDKERDAAAESLRKNPKAGQELVESMRGKPRAMTPTESALITMEIVRLGNESDAAGARLTEAKRLGDEEGARKAATDIGRIADQYDEATALAKKNTSSSGQSLVFAKLALKNDYSLAGLQRKLKEASGTKEPSKELQAQILQLHEEIKATQKAFDDYRAAQKARTPPRRPPAPGKVSSYLSARASEAKARIRARLASGRVSAGIDPADLKDYAIVGADFLARGVSKFADWSREMVKELGERIRPHLQDIFEAAKKETDDARKLSALKTRTTRSTEKLKGQLETGDFSKAERRPVPLDPEAIRLLAENARVKRKVELAVEQARLEARTVTQKAKDLTIAANRAGILSRVGIIAKLAAIIASRTVSTPVRQLLGYAGEKALSAIPGSDVAGRFESIPTFSGLVRSEAKALTAMVTKGLPGALKLLRMQDTDEQALLEKEHLPPGILSYASHVHAALHYPIQVADYVRRLELINEQDKRAGIDTEEPVTQLRNMHQAWEYSQRSVFLQNNKLVNAYKAALKTLEAPDKATGKPRQFYRLLAYGAQIETPIVKIPTNLAGDLTEHVAGLLDPAARMLFKGFDGFKGLNEGEADMLLRHLKSGLLGSFLVLYGYFKYKDVGGFYEQGEKRKKSDVGPGEMRLGNEKIPARLLDDIAFQAMNAGATLHRVMNQTYRKNGGDKKGWISGLMAVGVGIANFIPFVTNTTLLGKILDPKQREHAVAAEIASHAVPGFVQELAAQTDKKKPFSPKEDPVKRKITAPGFTGALKENLEKEIPVLREKLKRQSPYE